MNLQDRIEWFFEKMVDGEWGDAEGPGFHTLRTEGYIRDADMVIPLHTHRPADFPTRSLAPLLHQQLLNGLLELV